MSVDQWVTASSDDEIDLREVFAALRRRWRWVVGGGLVGMALAAGVDSFKKQELLLSQLNLVVDIAQGPCYSMQRKLKTYVEPSVAGLNCEGDVETMRYDLSALAKKFNFTASESKSNNLLSDEVVYTVDQLAFDEKGKERSATQLVLSLTVAPSQMSRASAALAQIQKQLSDLAANEVKVNDYDIEVGTRWIRVEEPTELVVKNSVFRFFALGSLGGLVVGAGSALIADRRSNRVYSQAELLRRLGHPLRLGLPAGPWSSPGVQVMVGQLATQLDQALAWRVLSIARQHDAVTPLTQLLQQQGGPDLQCSSADPFLSAVLRLDPRDQPVGLLLVVEAGFNSARALEEARLLISQMTAVQSVGVVLIGAQLPAELNSSVTG